MKALILTTLLLSLAYTVFGQEAFKKVYDIPEIIIYKNASNITLTKTEKVKFSDLSDIKKDSIRNLYPIGTKIKYIIEKNISGKKVNVFETITVDNEFYNKQVYEKETPVNNNKKIKGFVKFDDNKLTVNPYLKKDKDGKFGKRDIFYYQLQNRQAIKLNFKEWTVSALTIPFKYRFKNKDENIKEEFSTDFNANLFIGRTFCGTTSFFYRKDVGNITNTWKWTGGLLFGASTVTLNESNTSSASEPLGDGIEITKGLGSIGFGLTFSYNKINLGGFIGWDYSIGENAEKWNYNKEQWIGFAVGYSIFKF